VASLFICFRDSPQRRRALQAQPGSAERYALFGLDQLGDRGWTVRHNLERGRPPAWARASGAAVKGALERAGGYGGDFATVLASLREANRADVVLSTVDTVGIPLMLARRRGLLRRPLVYVAIGLPERLVRLGSARMRRLYASSLASAAAVVTYSEHEAAELERFLAEHDRSTQVEFVPFGVDTAAFTPDARTADVDVVSVGADPHRDFELLLRVAEGMPDVSFELVVAGDRARALGRLSSNVRVETDLPFDAMRERLERAQVVALPVRENSYSGATTVLLQAMALAKPVVVTRTAAIASGYGLEDARNVRFVSPGAQAELERAVTDLLGDQAAAVALGEAARSTVEAELSWERYVDRLDRLLRDAAGGRAPSRSEGG
jgi:glycosyltransferase involved in cell wall biosynthesis